MTNLQEEHATLQEDYAALKAEYAEIVAKKDARIAQLEKRISELEALVSGKVERDAQALDDTLRKALKEHRNTMAKREPYNT